MDREILSAPLPVPQASLCAPARGSSPAMTSAPVTRRRLGRPDRTPAGYERNVLPYAGDHL
jgi:hypothetical protein